MVRSVRLGYEIVREPPRRWPLILAGVISALALVAGLILSSRPDDLDGPVRAATHPQVSGVAEFALKGFAVASGTRTVFVIGTIVGAFVAMEWREWRPGAALVTAIVGASLTTRALKELFERPSPEEWAAGVELGTAFPSGHTAVAVAAWGLIVVLAVRRLRPVVATLVGTAGGVMLAGALVSRILLGDHWTSDVLAGAGLGGLWFCVGAEICLVCFGPARAGGPMDQGGPGARSSLA